MKSPRKRKPRRTTTSTRPRSSARSSRPKRKKSSRRLRTAYLGLGSNLGDRGQNLRAAIAHVARLGPLRRVSSFYSSEPVGFAEQPRFFNAVVAIDWAGSPARLLAAGKEIERRLGRKPTFRGGPRTIDVDVLDLGGLRRSRPDPILPHPRLSRRRFVLVPLAEIAPGWTHPRLGLSASALLARLPRRPSVRRIGGAAGGS